MNFSDVIGQQAVKAVLRRMVDEHRVPHALLLGGTQGVGKMPLALALASYLLCSEPRDGEPCGRCRDCLQTAKLEHPDLHFVFPIVKSKEAHITVCDDVLPRFRRALLDNPYLTIEQWFAMIGESKVGQIYTDEGSEIIRKVNLKPFQAPRKVMVIWLPELMHESCSNRVLKILEEPPLDTIFILVSDHPEQIIATIRSRCRQIELPPIEEVEMTDAIAQRYSVADAQLRYLSRTARGSWSRLLAQIDQTADQKRNFQLFVDMMRAAWRINVSEARRISTEFARAGRNSQLDFFRNAQRLLRDNFVLHLGIDEVSYLSAEENNFAAAFSRFINERNVLAISDELARAEAEIRQNVNSEVVVFHTILKLYIHLHKQ